MRRITSRTSLLLFELVQGNGYGIENCGGASPLKPLTSPFHCLASSGFRNSSTRIQFMPHNVRHRERKLFFITDFQGVEPNFTALDFSSRLVADITLDGNQPLVSAEVYNAAISQTSKYVYDGLLWRRDIIGRTDLNFERTHIDLKVRIIRTRRSRCCLEFCQMVLGIRTDVTAMATDSSYCPKHAMLSMYGQRVGSIAFAKLSSTTPAGTSTQQHVGRRRNSRYRCYNIKYQRITLIKRLTADTEASDPQDPSIQRTVHPQKLRPQGIARFDSDLSKELPLLELFERLEASSTPGHNCLILILVRRSSS